jgi:RNA polymerase sigma-70 factor (ECF subfamily)
MDGMKNLSRTEPEEWRVIDELYPALRRFAAVAAPWDVEPDDLLQEALVSVLRSRRLTDLDHPGAYLRRTMLNIAAGHSRRMGRHRRAMGRYAQTEPASVSPPFPSDLTDLLRIPPRERAALYLHEVEGYRYAEIGQMLGCSEAAAKRAGSRGRRHLGDALRAEVAP